MVIIYRLFKVTHKDLTPLSVPFELALNIMKIRKFRPDLKFSRV